MYMAFFMAAITISPTFNKLVERTLQTTLSADQKWMVWVAFSSIGLVIGIVIERQKETEYFNSNKQLIVNTISTMSEADDYAGVLAERAKYAFIKDPQLDEVIARAEAKEFEKKRNEEVTATKARAAATEARNEQAALRHQQAVQEYESSEWYRYCHSSKLMTYEKWGECFGEVWAEASTSALSCSALCNQLSAR